ncbi:Manganese/iron superoxide dismutase [Epithele typhae]|uniref:Manganese/iron superoxide dismutase n=1 Tax=Epithele typhae TaxID=378194 RepID=UPI0020085EDA|nr:Manganese/iron superoxide dismutase [Epithele typhae]KAH9942997.1 Manganese/iron superoxide dismutase [Epithele typhae]
MSAFGLRATASTSRTVRLSAVCARSCRVQSRALHARKQLAYPVEEGMGTFLPPPALKMISEDYQQGLLDRLNDLVRGTEFENKSIVQTVVQAARDPSKVLEFNYASEALNNSFFLDSLKPPPADAASHEHALTGTGLLTRIRTNYGSLAQFQSSFSAATLGMFSSGWLWLVMDQSGSVGIVPTFGAGTLLVASSQTSAALEEFRALVGDPVLTLSELDGQAPAFTSPTDPSLNRLLSAGTGASSPLTGAPIGGGVPSPADPHARSMSTLPRPSMAEAAFDSAQPKGGRFVGRTLFPLMCVSVHEHAWVSAGYGVWGKEEYMKRFWTVLDWEKVQRIYTNILRG